MAESIKVLIAEDEQALQMALSFELEQQGFNVAQAHDGQETIDMIRKNRPDILLLDLIMPRKDGFEVLREIREDPELKELPVIALTNLADPANEKKARAIGISEFLVKSDLDMKDVIIHIRRLTGGEGSDEEQDM